jgi:superfamily I DNA/RNA helicase
MALNPHQEQVANHFESRALVIAGPGSGKTSTITARIGRLLGRGVMPSAILCLTFTNKAAQEMRQRIEAKYGATGKKLHICTFHALAGQLLRLYGRVLGYTPGMKGSGRAAGSRIERGTPAVLRGHDSGATTIICLVLFTTTVGLSARQSSEI